MAACGCGFTTFVTEQGEMFAFGRNDLGQLGLGAQTVAQAHQLLPASVGGREVFAGEPLVMMATGRRHTAGVTKDGALWSWGNGHSGQLGHGDRAPRQYPERLDRKIFGRSPAVMVACGHEHTLVLTAMGCVWSCGFGHYGQLGHGDQVEKLVLTLVAKEQFQEAQIVMLASGGNHSVALGAEGDVWTWGSGIFGQLGHDDMQNRLVPTQLAGEALGGTAAVLVAAGGLHTVVVMIGGELWVWGYGRDGQLGLGDRTNRLEPVLVGAEDVFGEQVLMAACGNDHTLAVTKAGTLWSFGRGKDGKLGHNDTNDRLVPTQVEAHHFGHAKIVTAAAGVNHSAAVTEHGGLYTWGMGSYAEEWKEEEKEEEEEENIIPGGLGHCDGETKLAPTLVIPALLQGARIGHCHRLPPLHALAFAMGNHSRLGRAAQTALTAADNGKDCGYISMPGELVQQIVEACEVWPKGRAGKLEGVMRLLGGGMIKERELT